MNNKNVIIGGIIAFFLIGTLVIIVNFLMKPTRLASVEEEYIEDETIVENDNLFNGINIVKEIYNNSEKSNFLVSPYSIEYFLHMLKDSSTGSLNQEISTLLENTKLVKINNQDVYLGNAIFINPIYGIKNEYSYIIKNKYNGEIFNELSADKINNWVSSKTNKMITKVVDDSDLVDANFALLNAIYMDAKWEEEFACERTIKEDFTKLDGNKIPVNMMHKVVSNAQYIDGDIKGIILPYKDHKLEFIGLLPEDINSFVNNLSDDYLNSINNQVINKKVSLALPRFNYEYKNDKLKDVLGNLGIKSFANLDVACDDCFLGKVFHKAKIELDEKGTKAAAVTGGVVYKNAVSPDEIISLDFNKPFVYFIRDVATKKILFFGVTYEPNAYEEGSC